MGIFTSLLADVVVDALKDKDTRDSLIKGSKDFISSIFDEDGNGELDENELKNYCYAEEIDVMLMGYIADIKGVNSEWVEDYTQGLIDSKLEDDGPFNAVFCNNNDISPRKVKLALNDAFDEKYTLQEISAFSDEFELGENYFRTAMRAMLFASYKDGEIKQTEEQLEFSNMLAREFSISKLEARSILREYKNEALDWWIENAD
jgi:hypothetical protein